MAKSVTKNAFYNGIRIVSSMLFPLVTYPYATRVLLAENLGKVDFSTSLISYFNLIATLGIAAYAMREGSRVREDQEKLNHFSSQIFSINMVSTLIAYVLLAGLVVAWPHLHGYLNLIAIQSATLIAGTLGVEWVYTIEEDYGYITLRAIVVQFISAILLFLLVKCPEDYVIYAGISVFSSVGANIFNFFFARRYVKIRLTWDMDPKRHLKPILILFGNAIALNVYINIDVTLLNVMRGDYEVGIYSTATRVYSIIKALLNSMTSVAIPRLSFYRANDRTEEYDAQLASVAHGIIVTMLPALITIFLMADYVVLIIAGPTYADAVLPLRVLCGATIPAISASLVVNGILLTSAQERYILRCTVIAAVLNLVLNFFIIPPFGAAGAAMTTALAELSILVTATWYAREFCDIPEILNRIRRPLVTSIIATVAIVGAYYLLQAVLGYSIPSALITGVCIVILYAVVMVIRRDQLAVSAMSWVTAKLKK